MKRVLHIIDSFDLGGGQTALLNLVRATDRSRFAPEVAAMHGRGVFWREFKKLGVPVHSFSPHKLLPLYLLRIPQLLARRRFDIVHCHLFGANWIAKPLAGLLGVPVRITHDQCNDALRYERPLLCRWDTLTNRATSHICAVSASTRDFLLQHEGLPARQVSLVYNGVDLAQFTPSEPRWRHEPLTILGVGRLHPQKNFPLFLEVAAELRRRGHAVRFQIAGTGPEEALLRAQAAELQLGECLEFLGHVSDTRALYAQADLLLMTSRFEGTPLTILEAMAMELPIVAPRLDGIGEVLTHEQDALLVEPATRDGFVAAIECMIQQSTLATQLATSARAKVAREYSAEAMARKVEAIYERALAAAQE